MVDMQDGLIQTKTKQIKVYNKRLGQIPHLLFQMLPFTTVSANYHRFSSYFHVQESIGIILFIIYYSIFIYNPFHNLHTFKGGLQGQFLNKNTIAVIK